MTDNASPPAAADDGESASNAPRVVFISYKHDDVAIATQIASHFRDLAEQAERNIEVFVSNHPDFQGARFGATLQEEIARHLRITEVFFLVYTGRNKDYSWCMYEAGLATNPESAEGTRVIVFSMVGDVPEVFSGKVVVKARERGALEQLFRDFFFKPDFFPGERGALFDDNKLMRDATARKANELYTALSDYFDLDERREVPRWPTISLQFAQSAVAKFLDLVKQDPSAFSANGGARSAAITHFLENGIVTHSEKQGSEAFGFNWENAPVPLGRIRENWIDQRQTVSDRHIARNTPWDIVLAREVYNICRNTTVAPDWSPFLDLENTQKWLYPLISTSFINGDGSREFRIRIVPSLAPGDVVAGE